MEKNPPLVRNHDFHFKDHTVLSFYIILPQFNQTHNFTSRIFTATLSVQPISLPSTPRSSWCSLRYRFTFPNYKVSGLGNVLSTFRIAKERVKVSEKFEI